MSLILYLESQENQDMIRPLYFIRTQEGVRNGFFVCLGMKEMGGLYNSGGGNMNGRPFNEG